MTETTETDHPRPGVESEAHKFSLRQKPCCYHITSSTTLQVQPMQQVSNREPRPQTLLSQWLHLLSASIPRAWLFRLWATAVLAVTDARAQSVTERLEWGEVGDRAELCMCSEAPGVRGGGIKKYSCWTGEPRSQSSNDIAAFVPLYITQLGFSPLGNWKSHFTDCDVITGGPHTHM